MNNVNRPFGNCFYLTIFHRATKEEYVDNTENL